MNAVRHFLVDDDLTPAEQAEVLRLALKLKARPYAKQTFAGPQSVAVLFDKTSTRTRFSFDAAITQLQGRPIIVDSSSTQMGKGETLQDTGAVLSRFVSAIVWRTYAHDNFCQMAETATVPIINALSDSFHPCQILADLLTCVEQLCVSQEPEELRAKKAVYLGDGANNMAHSYLLGCATAGMNIAIAAPIEYQPSTQVVNRARTIAETTGAQITVGTSVDVIDGADAVITDTWVSMGMEEEASSRLEKLAPYRVTQELMARAAEGSIFLHCLPAYRGNEVDAAVIDGKQSKVFDEAENRLHAQKALLVWLMNHQPDGAL